MRIAIAELYQETCINSPETTTVDDFNVVRGGNVISEFKDSGSELGGYLDVADDADDVEVIPLLSARASPSGPVSDGAFETFATEFEEELRDTSLDGIAFAFHGAMMTASREDPEGELLGRIRKIVSDIPIVCTLDPHAHLTPQMVDTATALVAYQATPHVDILETGQRGMDLLVRTVRGEIEPVMAMTKVPTMLTNNQLFYERIKELEDTYPEVLSISYSAVQAFVDAEDMGHLGLVITDDDRELAAELSQEIAYEIWDRRDEGTPVRHPDRPLVPEVLERIAREEASELSVLMDDGDHMCAGAPGDSPVFLRELIYGEGTRDLTAAIHIVDPEAVAELTNSDIGPRTVQVGGKITTGFSPVAVKGEVTDVFEEPLTIRGKLYPGTKDFFGRRVVFELTDYDVTLILTENSGLANDPPFFQEHGVNLSDLDLVVIQCAHNVADFEELTDDIVRVKSPGVTAAPYDFLRKARPIYPVDDPTPTFDVFDGYWRLKS
ncbi:MlrC domain protein (plasmid) [Haloferax gibbonsii]|uniref:MlrC domain protein n=1 Tax=Haloferax gibbonsii TaxID=35746 RepID=A0A871BN09_HALGI|nr:M81 family metallopeptidase [Haloferax gibbonsii]QOS14095.1 MlrC domain protein [Haloferax gibbonsii]